MTLVRMRVQEPIAEQQQFLRSWVWALGRRIRPLDREAGRKDPPGEARARGDQARARREERAPARAAGREARPRSAAAGVLAYYVVVP